jgi:hypothetical protein
MKKLLIFLIIFSLASCAEKPLDEATARKVVELLMEKTDNADWEGIDEFYTAEFNASESVDIKVQKLVRLRDTLGQIKSKEFLSATKVAEFGRPQQIVLKYRVVHTRTTTIETFTLQEDEGGYKIAAHSVETEAGS